MANQINPQLFGYHPDDPKFRDLLIQMYKDEMLGENISPFVSVNSPASLVEDANTETNLNTGTTSDIYYPEDMYRIYEGGDTIKVHSIEGQDTVFSRYPDPTLEQMLLHNMTLDELNEYFYQND